MALDAGQLKQQAVDELTQIETTIEGLKGERKAIDDKIGAAENARKEAQRIVSALTPRAKRGEGKKAQAKKAAAQAAPEPATEPAAPARREPGPAEPAQVEPVADVVTDAALQAQVPASGTQPVVPFIPPSS